MHTTIITTHPAVIGNVIHYCPQPYCDPWHDRYPWGLEPWWRPRPRIIEVPVPVYIPVPVPAPAPQITLPPMILPAGTTEIKIEIKTHRANLSKKQSRRW